MNEAAASRARQSPAPRPPPMSGRPGDSFNKGPLHSGRFHFNQRRDLSSSAVWEKKPAWTQNAVKKTPLSWGRKN